MKFEYDELYRNLGLKISYYRKLRGFTQAQLAEKIGKDTSFLGSIESPNINRTLSLDTLFDIAQILDVKPHKFLEFD